MKRRRALVGHHGASIAHQVSRAGAVLVGQHLGHRRIEAHLVRVRVRVRVRVEGEGEG